MTDGNVDTANGAQAFLLELGRMLSLAGTAVSETQERLATIAAANGIDDTRIIVLPTALMIATGPTAQTTIDAIPQSTGALRLDQISALYEVVKLAESGHLNPAEGMARLRAVRCMRPRFGYVATVLAHLVMTVGLCLILQPTPLDVAVAAVFGAIVGSLIPLARLPGTPGVLTPMVCASIVSALTFIAVEHGFAGPGMGTLVAALTTFLPGGILATATVELASGEMVAGASRLVFGGLRLVLLAFGIVAGAELVGLPGVEALSDGSTSTLGWWAPWLGVILFGLAVGVFFSAPRGTMKWLLVVLLTAWLGQVVGDLLFGASVSGFFGAMAMTPVALAVARLPGGPPSQVTFLPAFWLLVPGAIGLIGVTELLSNPAGAGVEVLIEPLASIVAITLGVLCGVSAYRGVDSALSGRRARFLLRP
ncbi:threonine/serine exporter family protein [Actinoplanes sp. NPDC026623]|uniref:threonine/serine ThrE exporter family protein n=1 Tax=Actinoplanes sp. NPDC026623 TaxID=3155610 RepID=UPI003400620A